MRTSRAAPSTRRRISTTSRSSRCRFRNPSRPSSRARKRTRPRRRSSSGSCSRTIASPPRSSARVRSMGAATGWRAKWFFVKRALDRRPFIVLTNRGGGHFHTTASENIGELVRLIAAQPRTDAFNCGDPDPPTVLELARTIGEAAGHPSAEVLLPDPADRGEVGQTPWSASKPLLVDMTKAERELGYRPATTWADALPRQVEWLLDATRGRDWREVLPRGAESLQFHYEAEDQLVAVLFAG